MTNKQFTIQQMKEDISSIDPPDARATVSYRWMLSQAIAMLAKWMEQDVSRREQEKLSEIFKDSFAYLQNRIADHKSKNGNLN